MIKNMYFPAKGLGRKCFGSRGILMGSKPYHCLPTPPPKGETGSLPLSKQPVSFKNQITTLLHPFTAFHPPPEGVGQFGHSAKWPKIKRFWTKIYKKNPGAFTLGGESGNKNQSVTAKKPVSHPPVTPWGGGGVTGHTLSNGTVQTPPRL